MTRKSDFAARLTGMHETSVRAAGAKSQIFLMFMGISLSSLLDIL